MDLPHVLHLMTVLLEYIDRFAATCHKGRNIAINEFYIFSIMLNAFSDPLCSKLCWHNRRVPTNMQRFKSDSL